jgi:hypothetical protein
MNVVLTQQLSPGSCGVRTLEISTVQRWERQWLTRLSKSDPQALVLTEIAETRRVRLHRQADALRRRSTELIRDTERLRKRSLNLGA